MGTNIKSIGSVIEELMMIFNEYEISLSNENMSKMIYILEAEIDNLTGCILENEIEVATKQITLRENRVLIKDRKGQLERLNKKRTILTITDQIISSLINEFKIYEYIISTEKEFLERNTIPSTIKVFNNMIKPEKRKLFLSKKAKAEQYNIKCDNNVYNIAATSLKEKLVDFQKNEFYYQNLNTDIVNILTRLLDDEYFEKFINISLDELKRVIIKPSVFEMLASLIDIFKNIKDNNIINDDIDRFKSIIISLINSKKSDIANYVKIKGKYNSTSLQECTSLIQSIEYLLENLTKTNKDLGIEISEREFILNSLIHERKRLSKKNVFLNKTIYYLDIDDIINKLQYTTKYYKYFSDEELKQFEQELDNYMLKLKI